MRKHWAYPLIGRPWSNEFNCWALVREVFRIRWNIEMPVIGVGDLERIDNVMTIKQAAEASGWRRVHDTEPADGDILLGRDTIGKRHVGVMVQASNKLGLLHCDGHMSIGGPVGEVIFETLRDATRRGFYEIEVWRRHE